LEKADRKISVLRREIEKHELSGKVYSELAEQRGQKMEEEDLQSQVLRLNRQGISASVIAKRLGITLAEIELIISLGAGSMQKNEGEQP